MGLFLKRRRRRAPKLAVTSISLENIWNLVVELRVEFDHDSDRLSRRDGIMPPTPEETGIGASLGTLPRTHCENIKSMKPMLYIGVSVAGSPSPP
jgi:signal recognition particle subunit SEC65